MNDSTPIVATQRGESPYSQLSTYKLTRACWFALYAPDSGRHTALLSGDLPEPYRTLFDAILDGSRGLARVAVAGGPALELLDEVAQLPPPRAIPRRRLELPDNPELAAALFGRLADDLEIGGAGVGEWPGMPSHTCGAGAAVGTVLTFRPRRTQAARMFNPTWRTCPACLYQRAKRIARQTLITISVAGRMSYATLSAADWGKWVARTRKQKQRAADRVRRANARAMLERIGRGRIEESDGRRYWVVSQNTKGLTIARGSICGATGRRKSPPISIEYTPPAPKLPPADLVHYRAIPQDGGTVFVMATAGLAGTPVPTDRGQLLDLIRAHCAQTPQGRNVSSNRGYGGDFKRMRGDGRDSDGPAVQRYTDSALEAVAAALEVAMKPDTDRLNVQIDHTEALERLHLAGIALRDRRHVTHFAQSSKRGQRCTKSVTSTQAAAPPPPPIAPLLWPTEHATAGKEAAPCAIYLP